MVLHSRLGPKSHGSVSLRPRAVRGSEWDSANGIVRAVQESLGLFVSSFLVLFLETALIRWLPAYVRLLAYFSNFILLASFLGIGIGCLLAAPGVPSRRSQAKSANEGWRLIDWFPALLLGVLVAVDWLRLEVAVPSTSSLYFTSGTTAPVVPVESTLLLPLLFVAVGALFVTAAHRMGRAFEGRPPLSAYIVNL